MTAQLLIYNKSYDRYWNKEDYCFYQLFNKLIHYNLKSWGFIISQYMEQNEIKKQEKPKNQPN